MIQSRSLAGGPPEELPRPLGVVDDEPLEETEREPAGLELRLPEQAIGEKQPGRRPLARGSPRGIPRWIASMQRPAHAVGVADARSDPAARRRGTPDRPASRAAAASRSANASGSWTCSASSRPRASALGRRSATKAVARSVSRRSRAVGSSPADPSRRSRRRPVRPDQPEAVARLELALALGVGRDVRRRSPWRGPRRSRRRRSGAAVSTIRRRALVTQPSARIGTPIRTGRLKSTAHPGRDAPVVRRRQRPGHDLVEDRAHDPAVGDPVPALEPLGQRRGPSSSGRGRRADPGGCPCSFRLPHAKQWWGATSNAGRAAGSAAASAAVGRAGPGRAPVRSDRAAPSDLRRQGSAPCGPRS